MKRSVRFRLPKSKRRSPRRRSLYGGVHGGVRRDRSKPKCPEDAVDPFSQEYFLDIPKNRHIRLFDSGHYYCFDIEGLWTYVEKNRSQSKSITNPLNPGSIFSEEALAKIRRKWRKYERDQDEAPKTPFAQRTNRLGTLFFEY